MTKKLITIFYTPRSFNDSNEKIFVEAMDELAKAYKRYDSQADFGAIVSDDVATITIENQNFFPNYLQEALVRQGINNVRVKPFMGSSSLQWILDTIQERSGEEVQSLREIHNLTQSLVSYEFIRQEESNGGKQ